MEIFVSIDGVLRNTIQKFEYHYNDYYFDTETEEEETFEYGLIGEATNEKLTDTYKFQSDDEFVKFLYFDFPIEIFGHAGLSHSHAATEFNTLVFENEDKSFTLVGTGEKGKAKPASLFFLSKNGVICDNVKFSPIENTEKLWDTCDVWITDNREIIESCPEGKVAIKFNTPYNKHFTTSKEINKLSEIEKEWIQ